MPFNALDQQVVFDEFKSVIPDEISAPIRPHIAGGHAELHRYTNATEKPNSDLGLYDPTADHAYPWPNKSAGALVDLSFVQVYVDGALLRFFQDLVGTGGLITPVANYVNRIHTSSANGFVTSGTYLRDPQLNDRDVKIGDAVHLRASGTELWSYVADLIADQVAATVQAATSDPANAVTQTTSSSSTQTAGGNNKVISAVNGATYNGLATGDISETYTVLVTTGSTGGDATTARLRVTSASGRDDVPNVVPAAFASPTVLGTRGATITFSLDGARTPDPGVAPSDFVTGQTWRVVINQAFTAPAATSGGTYTGTEVGRNPKYIIQVTRGGNYTDPNPPQVSVTRDDGADSSGPTNVTAAALAVAIGTKGITASFSGTALRKGDVYYVPVIGITNGAVKTIVLGHNLPTGLQGAVDMDLEIFIRKNMEITQERTQTSGQYNWNADANYLTVYGGMTAFDPTLTNGGVQYAVPVMADANTHVYAHYRAWLSTYANQLMTVNTSADITNTLGSEDPDNPLAYGVWKAWRNANGTDIKFTAVPDPTSVADWEDVLPMLEGVYDVYSLVPLTHLSDVHSAWTAHVVARSPDSIGGEWRTVWLPLQAIPTSLVLDKTKTTDGNTAMGTLGDDPNVPGTQYTYLTVTSGNASFVTLGVLPGDVVRFLYSVDAFGNEAWQEFTVSTVVNQNSLILASGNNVGVTTAQRFEIWRNASRTQMANALTAVITANRNSRVRYVWPDQLGDGGRQVDGYYLAAALAGFVGGVAPQQSIRQVTVSGFDDASRSVIFFNNAQLNILEKAGCVDIVPDDSGNLYPRRARTSDPSSADTFEEVMVRNDDAFRHLLYGRIRTFFGQTNSSPTGLAKINAEVQAAINFAKGSTLIDRLGPMIVDASIQSLRQDVTDPTRIVLTVTTTRPYPVNEGTVTLVI